MICLCLKEPERSIACVSAAVQHDRGVSIPYHFVIGSWKLDILSHKQVIEWVKLIIDVIINNYC